MHLVESRNSGKGNGGRRTGRPRKSRKDSINELTGHSLHRCCTLHTTEADRQPPQQRRLSARVPQRRSGITVIY